MIKRQMIVFLIISLVICSLLRGNPNVLLTGYWSPTGQMIAPFSQDESLNPEGWIGENWLNKGYDVYSYFPEQVNYTGFFEVDYQDTSYDFWNIVSELNPIAIISFGVGFTTGGWEIEYNARNLFDWSPDFEIPLLPTPNPPDDSGPIGLYRYSTLPVEAIAEAVNANTTLQSEIDWFGDAGAFLCEYIFYHGTWYQAIHSSNFDDHPCLAAGFIHVDTILPLAQEAALITIETTLDYLNTFVDINGTIAAANVNPAGTILTLEGNKTYSLEIDNLTGDFTVPYIRSGVYDIAAVLEDYYYTADQIEINAFNNVFEFELEDWSNEDQLFYAEDPDNAFEGSAWSTYEVMTRYTQEDLDGLTGSVIGKVSFYAPMNSSDCTLYVKIYAAEPGILSPTEVIHLQEIEEFETNDHLVHGINLPISIESDKEYWVGYRIIASNATVGWFDSGTLVVNKGGWIKSNTWRQLDYYYDDPGNWAITTHVFSPAFTSAKNNLPDNIIIELTNYPNPFNLETKIAFDIPEAGRTKLEIFNIKGQKIRTLINEYLNADQHSVIWDGNNNSGKSVSSGIYFARLKAGDVEFSRKMLLLK